MSKECLVVLRRENREQKDDAQYSPYMPSYRYIVFYDYGHPTQLASTPFRTKREAEAWLQNKISKNNAKTKRKAPELRNYFLEG